MLRFYFGRLWQQVLSVVVKLTAKEERSSHMARKVTIWFDLKAISRLFRQEAWILPETLSDQVKR
jgi:hypothetical protein